MMRSTILLYFLWISHSCIGQDTKDEVVFKVQIKPETRYKQVIEEISESSVKYTGSEVFLHKLNSRGVQNPTIRNNETKMETLVRTGKLTDTNEFPIELELVRSKNSDGQSEIPEGSVFYGRGYLSESPSLDSMEPNEFDAAYKRTLIQTMLSTLTHFSFPEKTLKIGDSFSTVSLQSVPVGDVNIDMVITTRYKLRSIKNGIAGFDVTQSSRLKSGMMEYRVNASGSGKGKLVYDISNNFYLKYQLETEMAMTIKLDNFDLNLNSKSGYIHTTVISKNYTEGR